MCDRDTRDKLDVFRQIDRLVLSCSRSSKSSKSSKSILVGHWGRNNSSAIRQFFLRHAAEKLALCSWLFPATTTRRCPCFCSRARGRKKKQIERMKRFDNLPSPWRPDISGYNFIRALLSIEPSCAAKSVRPFPSFLPSFHPSSTIRHTSISFLPHPALS
ncbi:hypothetical protein MPTK1_7g04070 [Marchantia polymorpha subsp. ruderalis]|uniref:Uncharacterized protein n=2 Tax=Marchantia polymorpha TaxID=3197 RepID=A0AAF6BVZ0_MARPO|nr:hypothetical protein MARPO_0062s0118 [Marchantia polymorpha]BBN16174.1 hypothetical protein Mp_7g04070 [Marchantia polymorpha subsp. ruderalis]|eukprot:PTQ36708.1 hypothetical protein MARPO_0062s0118 [Marchantia polymorpha]